MSYWRPTVSSPGLQTPERHTAQATKFCTVTPNTYGSQYEICFLSHSSRQNFEALPRFSKNLRTPALALSTHIGVSSSFPKTFCFFPSEQLITYPLSYTWMNIYRTEWVQGTKNFVRDHDSVHRPKKYRVWKETCRMWPLISYYATSSLVLVNNW
jgi:hypothetical protein